MSRTRWIAVCTISLMATAAVVAAGDFFESMQRTSRWGENELPPSLPAGLPPDEGSWNQLNGLPPSVSVTWGDRLAASFDGSPGLWLYENGGWEQLTSVTADALVVACRSLVAAFAGYGLFLYDGEGWTPLHHQAPDGFEAWGNERLLINFGPGVGFWNYTCPVSVTCGFLDGTTWNVFHADPEFRRQVMQIEISGNQATVSSTEDGCGQPPDVVILDERCEFVVAFTDSGPLNDTCDFQHAEETVGGFTETAFNVDFWEWETYSGTNCPPDYYYRGHATGTPCLNSDCWPCD